MIINRRHHRGFTLIEIMVVIVVITILLSGIILPNIIKARREAQLQACCQNLKNIATALQLLENQEGDICGPLNIVVQGNLRYSSIGKKLLAGHYMAELPRCPTSDDDYSIEAVPYEYKVSASKQDIAKNGCWKLYCTSKKHGDNKAPHYYSWTGLIVK